VGRAPSPAAFAKSNLILAGAGFDFEGFIVSKFQDDRQDVETGETSQP
jgi:hypothetical protein